LRLSETDSRWTLRIWRAVTIGWEVVSQED
jgi:hypothetical protein